MGCDIHCYKEKQINGVWETADEWVAYDYGDDDKGVEVPYEKRYTGRNYKLFGLLSKGVRSEHPFSFEPRGLPFNLCAEIASKSGRMGVDGHSHSYLYLHELKDMQSFLKTQMVTISGMKNKDGLAALQASIDSQGETDWGLLYPYCGWGNGPDLVEFSIEVPASYIVGGGLDEIIAAFDGVDGDNHRVAFFFDN